jgi:cytochrome P450
MGRRLPHQTLRVPGHHAAAHALPWRSMTAAPSQRLPPGPRANNGGLLGQLRFAYGFLTDPIGFVRGRFAEYGDIYFVPSRTGEDAGLYVVRHPDHVREVLVTRAAAFTKQHSAFRQLAQFLGEGLLTSDGDSWKRQRRMVQPAFSTTRLAGYAAVMTEEAERLVATWRDGQRLDLGQAMMALTLRVVSRTLFGHDPTADIEAVGRAMAAFQDSLGVGSQFLPAWVPTPQRRRLRAGIETLDRIMGGLIERRRAASGGDAGDERPRDLLDMLVAAVDHEGDRRGMTTREIRDQLVTLFLAGHETTSNALTWTFGLLAQNPDVDARLAAELHEVLTTDAGAARPASHDDLPRLVYTERVISESMRIYPSVYSVARRAREATEIGGYTIPAGAEVMVWIYLTQHDPRWFPEPDAFRPDRFEAGAEARLPRSAYLPFGAGPRACIGKAFALIEAKILLATIARRFRFELAPGHELAVKPRITLTPRHAMRGILRARR